MPAHSTAIRVFLGSPADVIEERAHARTFIDSISQSGVLGDLSLKLVAWDSTPYETSTWMHPQRAIDKNLSRPSDCDIAIFIFWRRIGTRLPEETYPEDKRKELGLSDVPLTGSVWELTDAMSAGLRKEIPIVLTFRCSRPIPQAPKREREDAKAQEFAVQDMFEAFGSRFEVHPYTSVDEFDQLLQDKMGPTLNRIVKEQIAHSPISQGTRNSRIAPTWEFNAISPAHQMSEFTRRFVDYERRGRTLQRELMWYALMDVPTAWREAVFLEVFNDPKYPGDASWLVRRAMGCVLGELPEESHAKEIILNKLLTSPNWILACIGMVGGRQLVRSAKLESYYLNILKNDLMIDATWLAFLYLSDHKIDDVVELALKSKLARSEWGLLEIWKKQTPQLGDFASYIRRLYEEGVGKETLGVLATHGELMGEILGEMDGEVDKDQEVIECRLVDVLYRDRPRGTGHGFGSNWILRTLFGQWRDSLTPQLGPFLGSVQPEEIARNFDIASRLPLAEMRMGLFVYLEENEQVLEQFRENLTWGLKDRHPWVARSAVRAFSKLADSLSVNHGLDRLVRPGLLDYLIEMSELGLSQPPIRYRSKMLPNEIGALNRIGVVVQN